MVGAEIGGCVGTKQQQKVALGMDTPGREPERVEEGTKGSIFGRAVGGGGAEEAEIYVSLCGR